MHRITRFFCLFLLIFPLCVSAKPSRGVLPAFKKQKQLTGLEAKNFLEEFRHSSLPVNYSWLFELRHRPRRGEELYYEGRLWASAEQPQKMRVSVFPPIGQGGSPVNMAWEIGYNKDIWVYNFKDDPRILENIEMDSSVFGGLVLTAFDLSMPFIYWKDATYIQTSNVLGRPAHSYKLKAPKNYQGAIKEVEMFVDSKFYTLLRVNCKDENSKLVKTMKIQSFKKVAEHWTIKEISFMDAKTRDVTRLRLTGAAMDIPIDRTWFSPENLIEETNLIDYRQYKMIR